MDHMSVRVNCLQDFSDLQRQCDKDQIKFSEHSKNFALYTSLVNLGATKVQKTVKHLVQQGHLKWGQEEDFEVEAILDYVNEENGGQYLIKWKGWTHEHNTWEPKAHLGCPDLLEEFHKLFQAGCSKSDLYQKLSTITNNQNSSTNKQKIEDIYERLRKENITPLTLFEAFPVPHRIPGAPYHGYRKKLVAARRLHVTNKRSVAYRKLREEVTKALKVWEKKLNAIQTDPAPIYVENSVDLEGPPDNFCYINDYMEGIGITIPQDPIVGCECVDCFQEKTTCCGSNAGGEFAYYKNKRVRVPPGTPIYECNKRCKCGPQCPNRLVQLGRRHKVCLFRTANGRGWGVKALQKITKGSFVVEYVGEVITNEEAERRGTIYDAAGRTYLFDLDYNDGDCPFTVDAGYYGNISHFINHSCDPNLAVYGVWINTLDLRLPRIALFAQKDIAKGEELTFDYMMTGDTTGGHMTFQGTTDISNTVSETSQISELPPVESTLPDTSMDMPPTPPPSVSLNATSQNRIVCQCGSTNCRGYLF